MKAITPRYVSETIQSRAIYPSSRQSWFIFLLVLTKVLQCFGIFLVCDLMRTASAVSLVCFSKCVAGCAFVYLQQKGLSVGSKLTRAQVLRVTQYVSLSLAVTTLSYYAMTLCGPFRSLLLLQHHDFAVLNGVGGLLSAGAAARPAIFRGSILFIMAVLTLIFLDHDEITTHPEGNHLFSGLGSWLGLADHKMGVLLLTLLLLLRTGINVFGKRVAQDVGGLRNLHALSTLTEGVVLVPWTLISLCTQERPQLSLASFLLPAVVGTAFTLVVPYFADSACSQRLEVSRIARIGSVASFACALGIALLWNDDTSVKPSPPEDTDTVAVAVEYHSLSGGSILACTLFTFAAVSLTSACRQGAKGSFVGYSSAGLPLYNLTSSSSSLHNRSRSLLLLASSVLKQVLTDANSRRIFYFLCLNLSFTVIEFLYGIWTNSLGLISDGFHMLFDCSALIMGLLASVMARWKPSRTFSYGYGRVEDLSGFINGLFLLVISLFVFSKAVGRLLEPPMINTQRLLFVSVIGLVVNLVGIFAFSRHDGSSHSHKQHGHSHGGEGFHSHSHNANMEGVFLHIMADTLGSVGVIVSSILIQQFKWFVADPLCSIFIAMLIFVSVLPLLKQSAMVLLLSTPHDSDSKISDASSQIVGVEGVKSLKKLLMWRHSSSVNIGNVHVEVDAEASEQSVIQQVGSVLKQAGIHQFCVQVEKEELYQHMAGLSCQFKDPHSSHVRLLQL